MNTENVIIKILSLPRTFYSRGDVSLFSLLKDSDYFDISDQISVTDIIAVLRQHPEYIKDWLEWSENKRSSGWYFKRSEEDKYVVGHLSAKKNLEIIEYSDLAEACAAYIKKEVEDIKSKV